MNSIRNISPCFRATPSKFFTRQEVMLPLIRNDEDIAMQKKSTVRN